MLTPAQQRYLAEVRERPGRRYNGRARRPLEALRAAGLVTFEFDLRGVGGIGSVTEIFTVYPVTQEEPTMPTDEAHPHTSTFTRVIHGTKEDIIAELQKRADYYRVLADSDAVRTQRQKERYRGSAEGVEFAIGMLEDWVGESS